MVWDKKKSGSLKSSLIAAPIGSPLAFYSFACVWEIYSPMRLVPLFSFQSCFFVFFLFRRRSLNDPNPKWKQSNWRRHKKPTRSILCCCVIRYFYLFLQKSEERLTAQALWHPFHINMYRMERYESFETATIPMECWWNGWDIFLCLRAIPWFFI